MQRSRHGPPISTVWVPHTLIHQKDLTTHPLLLMLDVVCENLGTKSCPGPSPYTHITSYFPCAAYWSTLRLDTAGSPWTSVSTRLLDRYFLNISMYPPDYMASHFQRELSIILILSFLEYFCICYSVYCVYDTAGTFTITLLSQLLLHESHSLKQWCTIVFDSRTHLSCTVQI